MLQFFSASTSIVNSKRAITECLENALEGQPNLDCDLIIIYAAMGHNFKDLISEAHILSPKARIAGCTCAGVIGKNGPDESMTALAIMAIKGPKNEFAVLHRRTQMGIDSYLEAAQMSNELKKMNPNISLIQFLPNIFEWQPIDKAVEGIKSVFGPGIPIFGGVSMDNFKAINSYHFFDDQVVERGAIMIGYADPTLKFISRTNHGFNIVEGKSFKVTRSESNCIQELNGKPVWKELTETMGLPETAHWLEIVAIACFAKELPEELQEEYGSKYLLFSVVGKNEDQSIITNITCPIGMKIWLTKRNEEKMFNGVDLMMKKILDTLQENRPLAVFHADCVLRGRFSLNRILKDELINHLQFPIFRGENVPWLGLYSGGEFAMIGGQTWFHGLTSSLFIIYR